MLGKSIITIKTSLAAPPSDPVGVCQSWVATKLGLLLSDCTSLLFLLYHLIMPQHRGMSTSHCILESGPVGSPSMGLQGSLMFHPVGLKVEWVNL